ncbi:serine protease [Streptomyces kanasensis]|uniref:serine protease n=1 Tax=Streptomyces kanasensis TaxID=936756 RepID=UPI0036FC454F
MGRGDRATLVIICDQAGRTRGTGFVADARGTVVTAHETVDGLERVVVRGPDGREWTATADDVTALPAQALALVRTDGLGVRALPVADDPAPGAGTYVRVHAHGRREARVLGTTSARYTGTEGFHTVDEVVELAIGTDGSEALRRGGEAAGGPVLDAATGAVVAVLVTALHTDHHAAGLAVPLAATAARTPGGPLADLLRRNAATVPAYGSALNLAGALELTAGTLPAPAGGEPVARAAVARGLDRFAGPGAGHAAADPGEAGHGPVGAGAEEHGSVDSGRAAATVVLGRDTRRDGGTGRERDIAGSGPGPHGGGGLHGVAVAHGDTGRGRVIGPCGGTGPYDSTGQERGAGSERPVVCGLVGAPGTGRTTELAALARRRDAGDPPEPTVWLRGADLRPGDASVGDAVGRALGSAGRAVAAAHGDWSAYPGAGGGALDDMARRVAALARDAGRSLVVLLDAPEEMPPLLAHRLPAWTAATVRWLRAHGARLVVACRPEYWEGTAPLYPPGSLHRPGGPEAPDRPDGPGGRLPGAVHLGDLTDREAEEARERYGLPANLLAEADGRHPLTLRLLAEVRTALPGAVPGRPARADVLAAHHDLLCLRVAGRIAAGCRPPLSEPDVRRLAARVAGRVHEAARRCLVSGHGELDRASFEELFPWGTSWASAALAEGLLVPAGAGYRFAHEEFADWIQGAHVDVDTALDVLVPRVDEPPARADRLPHHPPGNPVPPAPPAPSGNPVPPAPPAPSGNPVPVGGAVPPVGTAPSGMALPSGDAVRPGDAPPPGCVALPGPRSPAGPVPRHRLGTVLQALLHLGRDRGPAALTRRLERLVDSGASTSEAVWWRTRLLCGTLLGVPDARPYGGVLRLLATRLAARPAAAAPDDAFGPWFWERLRLGEDELLDLLRLLLPADGPPGGPRRPRYLEAVARRLSADPRGVQPLLCRWFTDERPLPAEPGSRLRPTVAGVAQALLHTHRDLAVDDLCEALVTTAHPRADELLAGLADDEPSALCRAVDRWAHDDVRPARRAAAAAYGRVLAERVTRDADRELLRYAALALLARPGDPHLHGAALTVLLRDPHSRAAHLPQALAAFRAAGTGGTDGSGKADGAGGAGVTGATGGAGVVTAGARASGATVGAGVTGMTGMTGMTGVTGVTARALAAALTTHPEPVLAAFRARLRDGDPATAADVLTALADVRAPALARRAAALVREYADRHPAGAGHAAAYVDRRLERGPAARAVLFPLVADLLRGSTAEARAALVRVLAAPGTPGSRPLRDDLLDALLDLSHDDRRDPALPDTVLRAAAIGAAGRAEARTRELVLRAGRLLVRTAEGAAHLDLVLTELARDVPGFAALVSGWVARDPRSWASVVGPGARRAVERLAASGPAARAATVAARVPTAMPMPDGPRGHGTLRPAYRS